MNKEYNLILRTLRWAKRFRHRKGYGVHSPFAFNVITNIIYNGEPYYAYSALQENLSSGYDKESGLSEKDLRLLFRLANFQEAQNIALIGASETTEKYIRAARSHAPILKKSDTDSEAKIVAKNTTENASVMTEREKENIDFLYMNSAKGMPTEFDLSENALIVVRGIHTSPESEQFWTALKASGDITITFDLWRFGIALKRPKLHKQDYKIDYF